MERKTNGIQKITIATESRCALLNIRLNYVTSVLVIVKDIHIKLIGCTARTVREKKMLHNQKLMISREFEKIYMREFTTASANVKYVDSVVYVPFESN